MPKKSLSTSLYTKRRKEIQPYIDFRLPKNPKAKDKAKAKRYHEIIYGRIVTDQVGNKKHIAGVFNPKFHVPVFIKGRTNRAKLEQSEGQDHHRHIKAVFVETTADPTNPHGRLQRPRLKFNKAGVVKTFADIEQRFFPFNVELFFDESGDPLPPEALDAAVEAETARVLRENPKIKQWRLKVGRSAIQQPNSRRGIVDKVASLVRQYGSDTANFITGLIALSFHSQAALNEFVATSKTMRRPDRSKHAKKSSPNRRRRRLRN